MKFDDKTQVSKGQFVELSSGEWADLLPSQIPSEVYNQFNTKQHVKDPYSSENLARTLDGIEAIRTEAIKKDSDKPRYDLLPWDAIEEVVKVLTFGANKYEDHNWRKGFDWSRLYAACFRHLKAHITGQDKDPETGLSHLAHAMCCILFLMEHQMHGYGTDNRYKTYKEAEENNEKSSIT